MSNLGLDYKMSKRMFDSILESRTEDERKENPYTFVMNVVNREFGLKDIVKHVSVFDV